MVADDPDTQDLREEIDNIMKQQKDAAGNMHDVETAVAEEQESSAHMSLVEQAKAKYQKDLAKSAVENSSQDSGYVNPGDIAKTMPAPTPSRWTRMKQWGGRRADNAQAVGRFLNLKQKINDVAETNMGPAIIFIAIGMLDFWFNIDGKGQFEVWIDIGLTALAWAIFKSKLILIPAVMEIVFPVVGIQFGFTNVWPWWTIFGLIIALYQIGLGRMKLTPGGTFISIMVIALVVFTYNPQLLAAQQVLGSESDTDDLQDVGQEAKALGETAWFRAGGVLGDITNCISIPWLGGNGTCDGLQRRIDPSMADVMASDQIKDVAPTKVKIDLRESVDDLYFTFEDIYMTAEVDVSSGGYPLQGNFEWNIGDHNGSVAKNQFEAFKNGDVYSFEGSITGKWPRNSIPAGEYRAEFIASYAVLQFAKFRTWLVQYNPEYTKDDYDEIDVPFTSTVSDAMGGPAELSFNLGKRTAPMIIGTGENRIHGDIPMFVMKLLDPKAGSSSERLRTISYVRILKDDWFSFSPDSCPDIEDSGEYWSVSLERLNIENAKLNTLQRGKGSVIECPVEITASFPYADEAVEANMYIQVAYLYESKRVQNVKIEDQYKSSYKFDYIYCDESEKVTQEMIDNKIWETAYRYNVSLLIAKSVAMQESSLRQYDSETHLTIIGENKDEQGQVKCRDYGLYQITDCTNSEGEPYNPDFIIKDGMCDYEYNIEYGIKLLNKYYSQCNHWERTLNRYNGGGCYWSKEYAEGKSGAVWPYDKTSYAVNVEARCRSLGYSAEECESCIRNNVGCPATPIPPSLMLASNEPQTGTEVPAG